MNQLSAFYTCLIGMISFLTVVALADGIANKIKKRKLPADEFDNS